MAKDYAKGKGKKKKSGASRGKQNKSAPKGLILTALILVAGLITLLVYLKLYQPSVASKPKASQNTVKKVQPKQLATPKKTEKKPKNLDEEDEVPFYKTHKEMLNKTVEIPIEDLKLPESEHQYEYLMPCGSFRDAKRADELKAQIAFAGFESSINQVTVESGIWYRVELGPFKSKRKTESIRHRLQDNGFNYCKIWPKKVK
jgi:cell division protein FtsN